MDPERKLAINDARYTLLECCAATGEDQSIEGLLEIVDDLEAVILVLKREILIRNREASRGK